MAESDKELFVKIRDMSRKLRKGRFKFSDLEDLIDLEEDVLEANSDLLSFRFSELVNDLFIDYVMPKSVQLFGGIYEVFLLLTHSCFFHIFKFL